VPAVGRKPRRKAGLAVEEVDGHWHVRGRLRVKGQRKRVRESTGLPATADNRDGAEELRRQIESQVRDQIVWGVHPSVPFEVAVDRFLTRKRERGRLNAIDISRLQELERRFRGRLLNKIAEAEWTGFVDQRMQHCAAPTRERYIDLVMAFLSWCRARPQQWIAELPSFNRDKAARQRRQRRARRVGELRDELIELMIACAPPHLRPQIAIMWTAGGRVSSLLYDCRRPKGASRSPFTTPRTATMSSPRCIRGRRRSCANTLPGAAGCTIARGRCF
jgi:hypothetical protein